MKVCALSLVLLLTASAMAGCSGGPDKEDDLGGTIWIITNDYTEVENLSREESLLPYSSSTKYNSDIIAFSNNGSFVDNLKIYPEGCSQDRISSHDTVAFPANEFLCMAWYYPMNQYWRVGDNGHLVIFSLDIVSKEMFASEYYRELGIERHDEGKVDVKMGCDIIRNEFDYSLIDFSHYSIQLKVELSSDGEACEIRFEHEMVVIIEDGGIVMHLRHPETEHVIDIYENSNPYTGCLVGIEWTGQNELSEFEVAKIESLRSKCQATIPEDAIVWYCRFDVRLDSLPDFSQQSFNDSIAEHPGYPDWCGTLVPDNLSLDGSEPNLPPAEDLYGDNSSHCRDCVGYLRAQNETTFLDDGYYQDYCIDYAGGTWDEEYSMCSWPNFGRVGYECTPEADSQLLYHECLNATFPYFSQYTRYYWSGDYLYIGIAQYRYVVDYG